MPFIKKSIVIDCPAEKVYKFATDPTKWYQWYVGLSEPENIVGHGDAGTRMDMKYTIFDMHIPLKFEIVENTEKGDCYVWKGRISGAIESVQTWTYVPDEDSTEVMIDINYEVSGSLLGKTVDSLTLKKNQENAMELTIKNLKTLCES